MKKVKEAAYLKSSRKEKNGGGRQLTSVPRKCWKIRQTICKNQDYNEASKRPGGFAKHNSNQTHTIFLFDRKLCEQRKTYQMSSLF